MDGFESKISSQSQGNNNKPVVICGQVFAPDLTFLPLNPNETFVKDDADVCVGSNKTVTLNKTVSKPGGSTYGNHVPQFPFPDFSNSRHQCMWQNSHLKNAIFVFSRIN